MPIQQHPLPQDISSYRFRLIGDMTVKQFLYIAGFIILTILLHNSPVPFFFRYPLEVLSLGLGIGLAFVPVQGRPLDQWIIAFIKSIYSPTQYTWQQRPAAEIEPASSTQKLPPSPQTPLTTSTTTLDITPPSVILSETKNLGRLKRPHPTRSARSFDSAKAPLRMTKGEVQNDRENRPEPQLVTPSKPSLPNPSEAPKSAGGPPTANLPIPFTPDRPNIIVGLTLNPQGLILDGVLIEIISNGLTIRATKSNKLGQFLFAKALENGLYQIKAEKDNYKFTTYSISLDGKIVKPLKIQSYS